MLAGAPLFVLLLDLVFVCVLMFLFSWVEISFASITRRTSPPAQDIFLSHFFGLRWQSVATTALFPRAYLSQKKSGVALRFPPHSKGFYRLGRNWYWLCARHSGLRPVSQADLARFQRLGPHELQQFSLLHIFEQGLASAQD
jgi:hypothetical protein